MQQMTPLVSPIGHNEPGELDEVFDTTIPLACVAGVQRGGRGKINLSAKHVLAGVHFQDPNDRASHSNLTSPLPPLCKQAAIPFGSLTLKLPGKSDRCSLVLEIGIS